METQEIMEEVESLTEGTYLDYGTYYTGTEDRLFNDEDLNATKPITRTFTADSDIFIGQYVISSTLFYELSGNLMTAILQFSLYPPP